MQKSFANYSYTTDDTHITVQKDGVMILDQYAKYPIPTNCVNEQIFLDLVSDIPSLYTYLSGNYVKRWSIGKCPYQTYCGFEKTHECETRQISEYTIIYIVPGINTCVDNEDVSEEKGYRGFCLYKDNEILLIEDDVDPFYKYIPLNKVNSTVFKYLAESAEKAFQEASLGGEDNEDNEDKCIDSEHAIYTYLRCEMIMRFAGMQLVLDTNVKICCGTDCMYHDDDTFCESRVIEKDDMNYVLVYIPDMTVPYNNDRKKYIFTSEGELVSSDENMIKRPEIELSTTTL